MSKDVIIGGLLALSGVALTQIIILIKSCLDKRHEKKKILREKYEEFSANIIELITSFKKLIISTSINDIDSFHLNPIVIKLHSYTLIYFPEFKKKIFEISSKINNFSAEMLLSIVKQKLNKMKIEECIGMSSDKTSEIGNEFQKLYKLIEKYAKKYTGL